MEEKVTFSFGKNWKKFLKSLDKDSFRNAELSLTDFLQLRDLRGKTFLDIGCGSGLFSYSAFNLGSERIVSFDVDPLCVECCRYLHNKAGSPKNWQVYKGSILDNDFTSELDKFDIVYAWGTLHHTGKMWEAIKNSARLLKNGGYYYIAIYNKVEGRFGTAFWLKVKKLYNYSPAIIKYALEALYILRYYILPDLVRLRNPITDMKTYKSYRGMHWRTDLRDSLGGYPCEFAKVEEIFKFMKINFPDFNLVNIKTTNALENNWYLFKRDEN